MSDIEHLAAGPDEVTPSDSATPAPVESNALLGSIWEIAQTVLLALALFFLIRNFVQNYRIEGVSMEPNFHNGQFLVVNRYAYCPGFHLEVPPLEVNLDKTWCTRLPRRGDVIVFEYPRDPSRDFIKRVIGLPGDTVEVRSGQIFVNGQQMAEPFGPNPGSDTTAPVTVGEGEVFVMGDNRNNSSDSRFWGMLPMNNVIGEAIAAYWPPRYWSVVPRYDLTNLSLTETP